VVERQLLEEEGLRRQDLGREAFVNRVEEWKEEHGGIIIRQLKRLGCSCDWDRERYTQDADYCRWVLRVFTDLPCVDLCIHLHRPGERESGKDENSSQHSWKRQTAWAYSKLHGRNGGPLGIGSSRRRP
jgi:hypothetical protein